MIVKIKQVEGLQTSLDTKVSGAGSGTVNYVTKWSSTTGIADSQIRDDGTSIGIAVAPSSFEMVLIDANSLSNGLKVQNNDSGYAARTISDGVNATSANIAIEGIAKAATAAVTAAVNIGGQFLGGSTVPADVTSAISETFGAVIRAHESVKSAMGLYVDATTNNTEDNIGIQVSTANAGAGNNYAIIVPTGGGNVGLGVALPTSQLHVVGNFRLVDGTQINNYVLSTDGSGNASWVDVTTLVSGDGNIYDNDGTTGSGRIVTITDTLSLDNGQVIMDNNEALDTLVIGTQTVGTMRSGILFNSGQTNSSRIYDRSDGTFNNGLTFTSRNSVFDFLNATQADTTGTIRVGQLERVLSISGHTTNPLTIQGGTTPNAANDGIKFNTADASNVMQLRFEIEADASSVDAYFTSAVSSVGFGITSSLGSRVHIHGTGSGSGTKSLIAENSSSTEKFYVRDDGMVSATDGYSINGNLFAHQPSATSQVVIGVGTPTALTGIQNTIIGSSSAPAATTLQRSVIIGFNVVDDITAGRDNAIVGNFSAPLLTSVTEASVSFNAMLGNSNFTALVTGSYMTSVGQGAGSLITSGSGNTMLGALTGAETSGAYSHSIAIGRASKITASNQMVIGAATSGAYITNVHWGSGVEQNSIAPSTFTEHVTNIASGVTDISAGYDWVRNASGGTGTGLGGKHIFKVAPAGTTGSAQNTFVEALVIHQDGTVQFPTLSTTAVAGYVLQSTDTLGNADWVDPNTLISAGTGGIYGGSGTVPATTTATLTDTLTFGGNGTVVIGGTGKFQIGTKIESTVLSAIGTMGRVGHTLTNYGILFASGTTGIALNAPTGETVEIRINNAIQYSVASDGMLKGNSSLGMKIGAYTDQYGLGVQSGTLQSIIPIGATKFNWVVGTSGAGTEIMQLTDDGDLGIGVAPSARVHIQGEGATTATTFLIENSATTSILTIKDNGSFSLGYNTSPFSATTVVIGSAAVAHTDNSIVIGANADDNSGATRGRIVIGDSASVSVAGASYGIVIGSEAIVGTGITMGRLAVSDSGVAIGHSSIGSDGVAIGVAATINSAAQSVVIGGSASANFRYGVVIGHSASTSGDSGVAIGRSCVVNPASAIAIAPFSTITGVASISFGKNVTNSGNNSIAIGGTNNISADDALAIGYNTVASAVGAWIIGRDVSGKIPTNSTVDSFGLCWQEVEPQYLLAKTADSYLAGAGNLGIFTKVSANKFSITPQQYSTGTASQSINTITGVGTIWTAAMVGSQFIFADGTNAGTITTFTSTTSIDVVTSATVSSQAYNINYTGLQLDSTGRIGINQTNHAAALHVTDSIRFDGLSTTAAIGYVLQSTSVNGDLDWVDVTTLVSGDGNIYDNNGSLAAARTVTMGAFGLTFSDASGDIKIEDGKIGINTGGSTAVGLLEIVNVGTGQGMLRIGQSAGTTLPNVFVTDDGDFILGDDTKLAGAHKFETRLPENSVLGSHATFTHFMTTNDAFGQNIGGGIAFGGKYSAAVEPTVFAGINGVKATAASGNFDGRMNLTVRNAPNSGLVMKLDASGNVGIGLASADTISARVHIQGSGSGSGTTALLVENSSGTDYLSVKDDGLVTLSGGNVFQVNDTPFSNRNVNVLLQGLTSNGTGIIVAHTEAVGAAAIGGMSISMSGVTAINVALGLSAINGTSSNTALSITNGNVIISNPTTSKFLIGNNAFTSTSGLMNSVRQNTTTPTAHYHAFSFDSTSTTSYGFRYSGNSNIGGTATVYGVHTEVGGTGATNYGAHLRATVGANSKSAYGVNGIAEASLANTGTLRGGYFEAKLISIGTATTTNAYGVHSEVSTSVTGQTIGTAIGAKVSVTGVAGSTIDDIIGLEVAVTNAGTTTNNIYAAIFTGGNVGIGTTSPGALLHVDGSVRFDGLTTTAVVGYVLQATSVNGDLDWVDPNTLISAGTGGIYGGNGTVPSATIVTLTNNITFGSNLIHIDESNGNVGILSNSAANKFSVEPIFYNTGTASQSTNTITGVGTTWTSAMIGSQFTFADGTNAGTITAFTSATSIDVATSATVSSQAYSINYIGLQVDFRGHVGINNIAPSSGFHVSDTVIFDGLSSSPVDGYVLHSQGATGALDWIAPNAIGLFLDGQTTSASLIELLIGGGGGTRYPIATNSTKTFVVTVTAIQSAGTGTGDVWSHRFTGVIKNIAGTTSLIGTITEETLGEDTNTTTWTASVEADNTNDALTIDVTGEASKTIEWKAKIEEIENSY